LGDAGGADGSPTGVKLRGFDGYTTNLPFDVPLDDDVLVAHRVWCESLSQHHGWSARLVVATRYAWKGAKWISGIAFHEKSRAGCWAVRGDHNNADAWKEQRFGFPPGEINEQFAEIHDIRLAVGFGDSLPPVEKGLS